DDEHRCGQPRPDRAQIVKPLSDIEANKIQYESNCQTDCSGEYEKEAAIGKVLPSVTADEQSVACGKIQNTGIVRQIGCPVHPPGHEAGEFSEGFLTPQVNPSLFRISRREFQHAKRQWDKIR